MTKEEKNSIIENLTEQINNSKHFYLADISELNAADSSDLRRKCFEKEIKLILVKNTLLRKALERSEGTFDDLYGVLKNNTSIMFCETGNVPAKLIKEFRRNHERPVLKAAYVEESVYLGEESLEALATLKSKDELVADVIALLQSPAKNVVSSLKSAGGKLSGILKTLSEKEG